jgi:hypothetical protein
MPNNPRTPKRSWRDGGDSTKRSGPERDWAKDGKKAGGGGGGGLSRRSQIILAGGSLLTGLAVFIVILLWPRTPPPPRLVLIGSANETSLVTPLNTAGQHALDELSVWAKSQENAWAGQGKERGLEIRRHDLVSDGDAFTDALKPKDNEDIKKLPSLLMYVSLPGGADTEGAYLLPKDASPEKLGSPYRFDKALQALASLSPDTKKLLILDVTQDTAGPRLRQLHNDFVRALANESRLKTIKNLVILCASGDDQRSWYSEEYQCSIFAHYVLEGLKGAADLKEEGGDNAGIVNAKELADYVQKKVRHWVRHNRGALQTPVLIDPDNVAARMDLRTPEGNFKPEPPKEYPKLTGLLESWKKRDELAARTPAPWVYTPQLWRQYQDTLLRYEQMLREGDTNNLNSLKTRLESLEREIAPAQHLAPGVDGLPLECAERSLPLSLAFGWMPPSEDKRLQALIGLWQSRDPAGKPRAKADDFRRELDQATQPWENRLTRLRFSAWVLRQAQKSDVDFKRACEVLAALKVKDGNDPQPIEVHFALILDRDRALVPGGIDDKVLLKALAVRQRAEEATLGLDLTEGAEGVPYSEQVLPWIKEQIQKADAERRIGEDLLFGSTATAKDAAEHLATAETLYKEAQTKAVVVRLALATRDRALADLPYYTRWKAGPSYTGDELDERDREEVLARAKVDLWAQVHALSAKLDAPGFDKVADLEKPVQQLTDGFQSLSKLFQDRVASQPVTKVQKNWHEIEELLAVPFIEPARRVELITRSREISETLNAQTAEAGAAGGVEEKDNARMAKKGAQRRGRLALAELGIERPDLAETVKLVMQPGDETWWKSIDSAGDQIGKAFRNIAVEAARIPAEGKRKSLLTMLLDVPGGDTTKVSATLRRAALATRRLDGAQSIAYLSSSDPIKEYRDLQLFDLMGFQAERTYLDYWAALDLRDKRPFYRVAGDQFVANARMLIAPSSNERDGLLQPIEKKLNAADTLRLRDWGGYGEGGKVDELAFTDEPALEHIVGLSRPATVPPGTPVVWPTVKGPAKLIIGSGNAPLMFKDDPVLEKRQRTFVLKPQRSSKARESATLQYTALFRGRRLTLDVPVEIYNDPTLTALRYEKPSTARLVVQAPPEVLKRFNKNIEIVIILDCSGSMKEKVAAGKTRNQAVLEALEKALADLPAGVKLKLLSFSQEQNGDNGEPGALKTVWDNVTWDPKDKDYIATLMNRVRKLTPAYYTPLVHSIWKARDRFPKDKDQELSRSIVVLTDGADNTFYKDRGNPDKKEPADPNSGEHAEFFARNFPGKNITSFLADVFKESEIQVNVLGVDIKNPTTFEKKVLKEFKDGIKEIEGEYIDIEDSSKTELFAKKLGQSLYRPRFFIYDKSNRGKPPRVPGVDEDGAADISLQNEYRWLRGLKPSIYEIFLKVDSRKRSSRFQTESQRIALERGDALILTLTDVDGKLLFQPRPYVGPDPVVDPGRIVRQQPVEGAPWKLSVLQNRAREGDESRHPTLQMMAVVEKLSGPTNREDLVSLYRPEMVWFDLGLEKDKPSVRGLRFYPLDDYPGPAYALEVPDWPEDPERSKEAGKQVWRKPVLSAWWQEQNGKLPVAGSLLRGLNGLNSITDASRFQVPDLQVEGKAVKVHVESVRQESLEVKVGEARPPEKRECLVVRLRFPKDEPFFVQLPGSVAGSGAEHRFYLEAGKYTGIFWDVTREQAQNMEFLNLVAVRSLKRNTLLRVTNLELPEPSKNSVRPNPP